MDAGEGAARSAEAEAASADEDGADSGATGLKALGRCRRRTTGTNLTVVNADGTTAGLPLS